MMEQVDKVEIPKWLADHIEEVRNSPWLTKTPDEELIKEMVTHKLWQHDDWVGYHTITAIKAVVNGYVVKD